MSKNAPNILFTSQILSKLENILATQEIIIRQFLVHHGQFLLEDSYTVFNKCGHEIFSMEFDNKQKDERNYANGFNTTVNCIIINKERYRASLFNADALNNLREMVRAAYDAQEKARKEKQKQKEDAKNTQAQIEQEKLNQAQLRFLDEIIR